MENDIPPLPVKKHSDDLFLDLEKPASSMESNIPSMNNNFDKYIMANKNEEIAESQDNKDIKKTSNKPPSKSKINGYSGGTKLLTLLFEGFLKQKFSFYKFFVIRRSSFKIKGHNFMCNLHCPHKFSTLCI